MVHPLHMPRGCNITLNKIKQVSHTSDNICQRQCLTCGNLAIYLGLYIPGILIRNTLHIAKKIMNNQ